MAFRLAQRFAAPPPEAQPQRQTPNMFDPLAIRDAKPIAILKRIFVLVIIGLLGIGAISSYRAYVQVRSLELHADRELSVGSSVDVTVVGSIEQLPWGASSGRACRRQQFERYPSNFARTRTESI